VVYHRNEKAQMKSYEYLTKLNLLRDAEVKLSLRMIEPKLGHSSKAGEKPPDRIPGTSPTIAR